MDRFSGISRRGMLGGIGAGTIGSVLGIPPGVVGETSSNESEFVFDGGGAEEFNTVFQDASEVAGATLSIEPGTHELGPEDWWLDGNQPETVEFDNFTIEGNGATLICPDPTGGILWFGSGNDLTIKDLTIDYNPPPYTQCTIIAAPEDDNIVEVELDDDSPDLDHHLFETASVIGSSLHNEDGSMIDVVQQPLEPQEMILSDGIEQTGDRTYSVPLHESSPPEAFKTGRRMTLLVRGGSAFTFYNVDGLTLTDMTVRTAPGYGVFIRYCDDIHVSNYTVAPADDSDRLLTTLIDGISFEVNKSGPVIEDSTFKNTWDDAIAISTKMLEIGEVVDEYTIKPTEGDGFDIRSDHTVSAITHDGMVIDDIPQIESIDRDGWDDVKSGTPIINSITFEDTIAGIVSAGDAISNESARNAGFEIRDNTFENIRPRFIRVTSGPGLIKGNVMDGCNHWGILAHTQVEHTFSPKRWLQDLTIRNNTISNAGLRHFARENASAIAVLFRPIRHHRTETQPNTNITITENKVDSAGRSGIIVRDAANVEISHNELSGLNQMEVVPWQSFEPEWDNAGIQLENVHDIDVRENTIEGSRKELDRFGWIKDPSGFTQADNMLIIDGEPVSGLVDEPISFTFEFSDARWTGDVEHSFNCFEMVFKGPDGETVLQADLGVDEEGLFIGDGVRSGDSYDDRDDWGGVKEHYRDLGWGFEQGVRTSEFQLFKSDMNRIATVELLGYSHTEENTATLRVAGEKTDEVMIPNKELNRYTFSMGTPYIGLLETEIYNETVEPGESIYVDITYENSGIVAGSRDVEVRTGEIIVHQETITVEGKSTKTLSVDSVIDEPGQYELEVDGQAVGTVTVVEEATTTPEPTPTPTFTPTPSDSPTTPTPDEDGIPGPGIVGTVGSLVGAGYVLKWWSDNRGAEED